jgi:Ser/Thr protein kinase RdoA (MazF antagonist)
MCCAETSIVDVLHAFGSSISSSVVRPLGNGNINDTYLVQESSRRYVVQRINSTVFPRPFEIASNFALVSGHIARKSAASGISLSCPELIFTSSGDIAYTDECGSWWRAQSYVEHLPSHLLEFTPDRARQLGRVLGSFHMLTADIDLSQLFTPLPGFHITPRYLCRFEEALNQWSGSDSAQLDQCLEFVDKLRACSVLLEDAKAGGRLISCTIHGDPKLDNIIFETSGKAVGLFDLDTIGPGLLQYDIGDCLRSCCNRAGEGTTSTGSVVFDLDICRSVIAGYLNAAERMLSSFDRYYMYDAILVICFELGLRFLTDYLFGNVYFKVSDQQQNLRRALVQFHLAESVVCQEKEIRSFLRF